MIIPMTYGNDIILVTNFNKIYDQYLSHLNCEKYFINQNVEYLYVECDKLGKVKLCSTNPENIYFRVYTSDAIKTTLSLRSLYLSYKDVFKYNSYEEFILDIKLRYIICE